MWAGMIPILHLPGEMMPGQLGPMRRVAGWDFRYSHARIMSLAGMPSVMQTTSAIPASAASMMASAANGGGTKITDALAPACLTPSATVSNTGRSKCFWPPLPGVTPPTTLVPYAMACCAWKVPSLPVKPWTSRRVFSSTRMLMRSLHASRHNGLRLCRSCSQPHHFFGGVAHALGHREIQSGFFEDLAAELDIGAFHADHDGLFDAQLARGGDHSRG